MIGAYILPHGTLTLDPQHDHHLHSSNNVDPRPLQDAQLLSDAFIKCSQYIAEQNPEIILLLTPHGITLGEDFGIYLNSCARGNAEWDDEYQNYTASVNIETDVSKALIQYLKDSNNKRPIDVQSIITFSSSEPAPLRWGEVVPLYFIDTIHAEINNKPRYVILSIPSRRYKDAVNMIEELHELGHQLYDFFKHDKSVKSKRTIMVISGDLAHTHIMSPHISPSRKALYATSDTAIVFDKAIEKWIETGESKYLIEDAKVVLNQALSCGYAGFVIVSILIKF